MMKEKTVLEMHIDNIEDFNWLGFWKDDESEFANLDSDEAIAEAAKLWKMTPEAVKAIDDAFGYMAETLLENIRADLKDLYELI